MAEFRDPADSVGDEDNSDVRTVIELSNRDTIDGTVFSKSWVLGLLVRLVEAVKSDQDQVQDKDSVKEVPAGQTSSESTSATEKELGKCAVSSPLEIEPHQKQSNDEGECGGSTICMQQQEFPEEGIECDLCKIWDASTNTSMSLFLHENSVVELLLGSVARLKSSRLTEICVGIIGNMMCNEQICHEAIGTTSSVSNVLSLLNNPDSHVLIEAIRLILMCLSHEQEQRLWLDTLKSAPSVLDDIIFILKSSINYDLLRMLSTLLDRLLDLDDSLCSKWSCESFVSAICEASEQCRSSALDVCCTLMLSLQSLSTSEAGVQELVTCRHVSKCLVSFLNSASLHHEEWYRQDISTRGLMACLSLCHCILENNSRDNHMTNLIKGKNVELFVQKLSYLSTAAHSAREDSSWSKIEDAEWQTAEENIDSLVADGIRNLAKNILTLLNE